MMAFAGQVAVVTGASRGIGFETARQLAQKGFNVFVGSRTIQDSEKAVDQLKRNGVQSVFPIAIELTSEPSLAEAARHVQSKFGRVDALVNNAAIMDYHNTCIPVKMPQLRKEFDTNFFGQVAVTNEFLPLLMKAPIPRIVFVSTPLATHGNLDNPTNKYSNVNFTSYKCSKAAMSIYAHNLAVALKDRCPTAKVNCGYPGYVKTDMSNFDAPMEASEGAETSVYLATLGEDGPTGGFFHKSVRLPW